MKNERVADLSSTPSCTAPISPNVKKWMRLFAEGKFTYSVLKNYLVNLIPATSDELVVPGSDVPGCVESSELASVVVSELEQFVYNGERGPVLDYLRGVEDVPSYCGRTLKNGEPAYSCRECGMDGTCVLCTVCFQQSEHRFHKYRMGTSEGGGFCDCGDVEAWKSSPFCTAHSHPPTKQVIVEVPDELRQRCSLAFSFIVQFSLEVISKFFNVESWDKSNPNNSKYLLVVYNDEVHTFDQVIDVLVNVVNCSAREGLQLASKIDSEGRVVILASDYETCSRLKLLVEKLSSTRRSKELEVDILPFYAAAYQQFALFFLDWLRKTAGQSVGLRSVLSAVLHDKETSSNTQSLLDKILLQDPVLWKSARVHWHSLVCSAMLTEYEHKKILANAFVTNYESIVNNYLIGNDSYQFCSASLSVQLFTIPSVNLTLISDRNILKVAIDFIIDAYTPDRNFPVSFKPPPPIEFKRRATQVLNDIKYLLCSPPTNWTEPLREGFLKGMSSFLDLLNLIEGLDAVTRQLDTYTDVEAESRATFNLMLDVFPVISALNRWCESDKSVLIESYKMVLNRLNSLESQLFYSETVKSFGGREALCSSVNLALVPVTLQTPMTRFWGGLYSYLNAHQLSFNSDEVAVPERESPLKLIEPVVRSQALLAQFQARMWQKNGQSLARQIALYRSRTFLPMMLEKDLTVLQIGASLMESDAFLINLISEFGLLHWTADELKCDMPETDTQQLLTLINEFLYLIIVIVAERYQSGVGDVTTTDCIKYQMIHQLAARPMSHSELVKAVSIRADSEGSLEAIIEETAVFKASDDNEENGLYVLKDGYASCFNVYFYHFSKEESLKAERSQMKSHKIANGLECCPPPVLPPFLHSFGRIINLLKCDVMLDIMVLVLKMCASSKEDFGLESQLHQLLFLIGMALREEEVSNGSFGFIPRAKEWGLNLLLVKLSQNIQLKNHKDIITWVMNRYRSLSDDLLVNDCFPNNFTDDTTAKRLAAEAKTNILARMKSMQEQFAKSLSDQITEESEPSPSSNSADCPKNLGSKNDVRCDEKLVACIICQFCEKVSEKGPVMLLPAYVQLSTVLVTKWSLEYSVDNEDFERLLTSKPTPYVSTCGHPMHADCLEAWKTESVRKKANEAPISLLALEADQNEFLCPLCQCVSNSTLPILPRSGVEQVQATSLTFTQWVNDISSSLQNKLTGEFYTTNQGLEYIEKEYPETPALQINVPSSSIPPNSSLVIDRANVSLSDIGPESTNDNAETSPEPASEAHQEEDLGCSLGTPHVGCAKSSVELPDNEMDRACGNFFKMVCAVANGKKSTAEDSWNPTMIWKTIAYTIRSTENCRRFAGQPVLGTLSFREQHCLENLVQLADKLGERASGAVANMRIWKLLSVILDNKSARFNVLNLDSFGILLMLLETVPNIKGDDKDTISTTPEKFIWHLMLIFHIFQIVISMDLRKVSDPSEGGTSDDTASLSFLTKVLRNHCSYINTVTVWREIEENAIPFLRCCAFLNHIRTKRYLTECVEITNIDSYESLCSYLQLPTTCNELFGDVTTQSLIASWATSPQIEHLYREVQEKEYHSSMTRSIQLVPLPEDYSELLNRVQTFACSNSNRDDAKNPIMCLVCGEILCSLSYCCQTELNDLKVGACTAHIQQCGGGTGLFLRIRTCQVMMLAGCGRGCFRVPPYLDDHNEPDQGLRRGNRLHLNQNIYRKLQLAWMNHSIYEEVSRAMESKYSLIRWHYF